MEHASDSRRLFLTGARGLLEFWIESRSHAAVEPGSTGSFGLFSVEPVFRAIETGSQSSRFGWALSTEPRMAGNSQAEVDRHRRDTYQPGANPYQLAFDGL